jgi:hypothetical protein
MKSWHYQHILSNLLSFLKEESGLHHHALHVLSSLATYKPTFSVCLVNVYASTASTALWFQHSEIKPKFHHLLPIQGDQEIRHHLCGITLASQS